MPALDYARLAALYDGYCVFDQDVAHFVRFAAEARGPVLELMAGTGRISLPLLATGCDLTCVDRSPEMLWVLAGKRRRRGLGGRLVCADVTALPLTGPFARVLLPFQGYSELVGEAERRRALAEAYRVLAPGGLFAGTLHNPAIRCRTLDGTWHEVGTYPHPAGEGTLAVHIRASLDAATGAVRGTQRLILRDAAGAVTEEIGLPLRFHLSEPERFLRRAVEAGFEVVSEAGGFGGEPYDPEASPVFVWTLRRP